MKSLFIFLSFTLIIFAISCSDDEQPIPPDDIPSDNIPLIADAGENLESSIGNTVTLDGSASTGPEGFTYLWEYEGQISIDLSNPTTPNPSFTPSINGIYLFTLSTFSETDTSMANVGVTVSGVIELGGEIEENLILKNIELNPDLPDYVVTSDLIVPQGLSLSIAENDITIHFESNTGLVVSGYLSNQDISNSIEIQDSKFTSDASGWKGIHVDAGIIALRNATFNNAGFSSFDGLEGAAAITFSNSAEIIEFTDISFVNSPECDFNAIGNISVENSIDRISFSAPAPYKSSVIFHSKVGETNEFPSSYDYVVLTPLDTGIQVSGTLVFYKAKYRLVSDLILESVFLDAGAELYIPENGGIIINERFSSSSFGANLITGYDEAKWKGILILGGSDFSSFNAVTIKNAGVGMFDDIILNPQEAAIYNKGELGIAMDNSVIDGSNGYGYYHDNDSAKIGLIIKNSNFENLDKAGWRLNNELIWQTLRSDHGNSFQINNGGPAILLESGSGRLDGTWPEISDNYYSVDMDLSSYGSWTLEPGVRIKMGAEKHIRWWGSTNPQFLTALGTSSKPIIIEGKESTQGYWKGLILAGRFRMEHCIIRDGGGGLLEDTTQPANVIFRFVIQDGSNSATFKNVHIENSLGYGLSVVNENDPGVTDPENNITYNNNTLGNVVIDNL